MLLSSQLALNITTDWNPLIISHVAAKKYKEQCEESLCPEL